MRNLRISASLVLTALLAACGGGGGGSSALPSVGGGTTSHQMATATFKFKIPGKATMAQLRRPFYSSQATQGVAIDWQSTDATHPDLAFAISATCPTTLPQGITACGPDPNGGTDYTFTFPIPPGNYTFTVSTFDAAPTAGAFTSPAAMLAQGQLPAPLVVSAGQSLTVPSMTFYGVPASVSFVPGASQSHVTQTGAKSYAIIGNEPQKFFVEALDADGFVIASSDSGAPSIMVCESTSDPQQYFKISGTSDPNAFMLQAMSAPSGTTGATIEAEATAGGTGLPTVTTDYQLLPVQELWEITTSGSKPGLVGYSLLRGATELSNPIDDIYDDPNLNLCGSATTCSFVAGTGNVDGSFILGTPNLVDNGKLYQIAGTGGPLALPTAALPYVPQYQVSNIATDAMGHVFIVDSEMGTLTELNAATDSTANAVSTDTFVAPSALTVAPSISTIPSLVQQTVWVGDSSSTPLHAYTLSGSTLTSIPVTFKGTAPTTVQSIAFDSNGYLWVFDGSEFYMFSVNFVAVGGGSPGAVLQELLTAPYTPLDGPVTGSTLAATADGYVYYISQYFGEVAMHANSCPTNCTIYENGSGGTTSVANFITP